jgi:DNA-binding XRE family transcriptional regulator
MSAHTKTHPISSDPKVKERRSTRNTTPWRKVAAKNIKKHTEPGLMLVGSRYKNEMTQKQVAEALKIHRHHVSEMEHGKRSISKEMARKLGRLFKVDHRMFL